MDREKITLSGAQETMLATLYGRALNSRSPKSVLHDDEAARAVRRIDYDFRRTGVAATTAAGVALRARQLDGIPADRPAVAVFEGLTMYLRKEDGKRLIQRITGRFPGGQLLFDA
ncbi:hypothetical protein [Planobispora longispora]|uniref:Uncharacterized protein n=1 Tax=Planobispora longispora TaxID=28887 RepID=A0A8J3RT18_9ACTN|nr:hypothetical protein [Planobispora longispora]BFE87699.1 hypothetical protein GCM10020093_103000 [Planobispora longispora]GIH77743.1 hypothetical protein Plo01_41720 [Planobispora longispora]